MEQIINGRYQVVRELGKGGMGQVFLVEDRDRNGLQLALKTLLSKSGETAFLEQFRVEFSELAKLSHPNIAKAYDFGVIANSSERFFTTEFVEAVELGEAAQGATIEQKIDLTAQLLRGLEFLHSHHFLHNDLKPANVLVARAATTGRNHLDNVSRLEAAVFGMAGQVKLIDFGLLSAENVAWKNIRGTARYISPERIRCQQADRRSDLYSLGCVLYNLFSGQHAFTGKSSKAMLMQHLQKSPVPIEEHCPDLPVAVVELIHSLMQKDPADRMASAQEALVFLGEMLGWNKSVPRTRKQEIDVGKLVLRDAELETLRQAFEAVAKGENAQPCVAVSGKEGVGKTRLVEELRSCVQVRGGVFVGLGGSSVRRHLLPVLEAVVADLKRRGVPGLERYTAVIEGGEQGTSEVAFLLRKLIFASAARLPVVIHFDDFQHTSPIVRQFALELAHTAYTELEAAQPDAKPRLLLIFSSNGREHQAKVAIPEMQTVDVKPFDEKCSRDFIRRLFGQDDVPEEIVNRLAPVAQGNPRMLVELSKTLVREKLVRYSGSRWVFPESLSGVALPGTLVDSLLERLRSLGSTTRALLDWLSITYSSVTATVLSRLMNTPVEDLEGLLKRLIRDGLVARDERFDDPQYDMAHQGLKEHIAKEHTEERRKFLHQRMAQTFERDLGEGDQQETARAELLAHHWLAADNPAAVLRYAPSAAGYLQRAGSLQKALEYHQLLFENMQTEALAKKIKSLARLAEMHELLWDLEGSTAHLNKILELGGNLLRPNDRASLLRRMAGIEIARQDHGKAIKRLTESRNALDGGHADPITTLSVDAPEAWARWMAGESDAAHSLLKRAEATLSTLDAAASTSDPRSRALRIASVSHLANLHHHLGHLDRATTLHRQNLELLEGQEMPQAEAATRTSLSTALLDAGDKEEAIGHLEAAIELGSEIGDRRTLCRARERLGELHFLYRDLRSALHVAQMSLDDAKALKNLSAVANSRMLLGRIYHRAGQGNDAAEVFRRALGVYRELGDRTGLCLCQIHLTRNFIVEGKTLKAVEQVDHLKSELGPEVSSRVHALYKLTQAEVDFCASGKVDLAACQEAQSTLEEGGFKRDSLSIRLFACHVATSRSEFDKARSLLEELADPLEHIGSKEQQAEARLIRAHIEVGGGYCETAVETLNELSRWASRNVFPRLVDRCNDTSRELLDVSLSV